MGEAELCFSSPNNNVSMHCAPLTATDEPIVGRKTARWNLRLLPAFAALYALLRSGLHPAWKTRRCICLSQARRRDLVHTFLPHIVAANEELRFVEDVRADWTLQGFSQVGINEVHF